MIYMHKLQEKLIQRMGYHKKVENTDNKIIAHINFLKFLSQYLWCNVTKRTEGLLTSQMNFIWSFSSF